MPPVTVVPCTSCQSAAAEPALPPLTTPFNHISLIFALVHLKVTGQVVWPDAIVHEVAGESAMVAAGVVGTVGAVGIVHCAKLTVNAIVSCSSFAPK